MILPNRYRHLHLRQHLQRYLLFSIVCVSIPFATSYVVVRKEKDFLAFLTDVSFPQCGKYNALGSVQGGKIGCECGNGRGVESSFHGLLKDQKPHCYSSADLGCNVTLSNLDSGAIDSFNNKNLTYPNTLSALNFDSYKIQVWNIDANSTGIWEDVPTLFARDYFSLEQNLTILKTSNLTIWKGHAIKILISSNANSNAKDQCLFLKVPGKLRYPATIDGIYEPSYTTEVPMPSSLYLQPSANHPPSSSRSATNFPYWTEIIAASPTAVDAVVLETTQYIKRNTVNVGVSIATTRTTMLTDFPGEIKTTTVTQYYFSENINEATVSATASNSLQTSSPIVNSTNDQAVSNAPVIAGVTTSLLLLLVLTTVALFFIMRKRMKRRGQVLPHDDHHIRLDCKVPPSPTSTTHSISSADDAIEKSCREKESQENEQNDDFVKSFKGIDEL